MATATPHEVLPHPPVDAYKGHRPSEDKECTLVQPGQLAVDKVGDHKAKCYGAYDHRRTDRRTVTSVATPTTPSHLRLDVPLALRLP